MEMRKSGNEHENLDPDYEQLANEALRNNRIKFMFWNNS